ncbi:hypothetical protein LguiA_005709 [Lonicera macranthoides]
MYGIDAVSRATVSAFDLCASPDESASDGKLDVYKEWTSRKPWKERKRASKAKENGTSQLVSQIQDPELIFSGPILEWSISIRVLFLSWWTCIDVAKDWPCKSGRIPKTLRINESERATKKREGEAVVYQGADEAMRSNESERARKK